MKASPVFPPHRLPPGFLATLQDPPDPPAVPRPSATLVPLRAGPGGLEVLLLQRSPRSGFIPGAWVFPGGTLDEEDGAEGFSQRVLLPSPDDRNPARPGRSPDLTEPPDLDPPLPFWVAALRETFEETGILLGLCDRTFPSGRLREARSALLAGGTLFENVLESLGTTLDASEMAYTAHWVTPECEPRRYETRFFMTEVPPGARVEPHELEMVDALWLSPEEALARNQSGTLPMVLPTISALEDLTPFASPDEALVALDGKDVDRRLPVPEQTPAGVRFLLS